MAQLQQQSVQHQQQQKVLAAAAVGASTASGFSTVSSAASVSAQAMQNQQQHKALAAVVSTQTSSKLLLTMAGGSSSAMSGSLPPMTTTTTTAATQPGMLMGESPVSDVGSTIKSRSKPRQNVASNGIEGQPIPTDAGRVSGQTIGASKATRHSMATSEVMNGPTGQQNSSSKVGEVRHHSRNKASAKTGLGTYSSSSLASSDKKSRQKSSK